MHKHQCNLSYNNLLQQDLSEITVIRPTYILQLFYN